MEPLVRVHVIVSGTVQGVGFRAFTQYQASKMDLHGWVRNRPDGTVEVEIEGPQLTIENFIQILHQGPQYSQVKHIEVDWKEPNRQTDGFQIVR